jgi:pimeloyl-ACP methyl ester carboxylesterase
VENDQFRSIDHRRDYRKSMERITTPMLFIAGNKDRIAPPPSVKDAHDVVASADKKFVIASRGHGFKANYGHFDLVLGKHSAEEIFPLVGDWLAAHQEVVLEEMGGSGGAGAPKAHREAAPPD